jgi:hypothetical protein
LFTFGSFGQIVALIFEPLLSAVKAVQYILTKNGLGNSLGDFFTNASGHPGFQQSLKYENEDRQVKHVSGMA